MPAWPMAMPSVTVMVVNSRGVPLAALTPSLTACACRFSEMLQGAASFQQVANRIIDLMCLHTMDAQRFANTRRAKLIKP